MKSEMTQPSEGAEIYSEWPELGISLMTQVHHTSHFQSPMYFTLNISLGNPHRVGIICAYYPIVIAPSD